MPDLAVTLYLVVPLLVLVAVVQTSVVPRLPIWGVFADLPLLVVASWGLLAGVREGAVWGLIAGIAVDLLSGAPVGAATLALLAAGSLAGLAHSAAPKGQLFFLLTSMYLATLVYDLTFMLVLQISGRTVVWLGSILRIVLPSAVLNSLLAPVVYWLLGRLHTRFAREEMAW